MTDQARIAEAITVLASRLASWGVDDAQAKAHEYVNDMLRNGWRPKSRAIDTPPMRPPQPATDVSRHIQAARAALRARAEQPDRPSETEETENA